MLILNYLNASKRWRFTLVSLGIVRSPLAHESLKI
jgi:hypothetical protein